jgi:Calcineurin-like phosphoesterase
MSDESSAISRRNALKCLAYGAGTLFTLSGGILTPMDLAVAATDKNIRMGTGRPLFVQISDTHIGFTKDANPDVSGTLNQLLSRLRTTELHTVPGEHDTTDERVSEYFNRFGKASNNKGYYSFDHAGVHFIALINVLQFRAGGLGTLGAEQIAWAVADLKRRSASTPIVVFAHMPLWTIYEPWGWGTADVEPLMAELKRFGSVTVLNGHIHQIVQKVEGHITFHTARSTAYPQPAVGEGAGPGPLKVPAEQLPKMLGVTSVSLLKHPQAFTLNDSTIAS